MARDPLGEGFELRRSSPDVGRDIGSGISSGKVDDSVNLVGNHAPTSSSCTVSLRRR